MDVATDLLDTHMVAKAQLVGCMNVYVSVHVSVYVSVCVYVCSEIYHIISPLVPLTYARCDYLPLNGLMIPSNLICMYIGLGYHWI